MGNNNKEAVVLIHGLWMKGFELFYLFIRLRLQGYQVYFFRYSSLFKTPEENAQRLIKFIDDINETEIHFIAHSLGGIVVAHFFNKAKTAVKGKVVFLASPLNGSAVADYIVRNKYLSWILGKSIVKGLLGGVPAWTYQTKTCVIAGVAGFGAGKLFAGSVMKNKNDGTVNLNETELALADESHEVPHSHFGILFSNDVVSKILNFLKT